MGEKQKEVSANSRFQLLSDEDMKRLSDKASNVNTKWSTKNWLSTFTAWASVRGKNPKLEEYVVDKSEMDNVLSFFFGELRKKNGKDYEPDSLGVMQASIQWYLSEKKCGVNILSDVEFEGSRSVLEGKAK